MLSATKSTFAHVDEQVEFRYIKVVVGSLLWGRFECLLFVWIESLRRKIMSSGIYTPSDSLVNSIVRIISTKLGLYSA